jgi:DNA-binding transcriptional ArsR family regulator
LTDENNVDLPPTVEHSIEEWGGPEGLKRMKLDPSVLDRLEKVYSLLSARGRIEILYYLNFSELTPGLITDLTGMAPNLVSFHLKKLESVGVVESERNGRFLIYGITDLGRSLLGPLDG